MNIFFLASKPEEAARYHCDKHVLKMILETAQLLETAHGSDAWHKHPCAVWARQSSGNYRWLARLGLALLQEYTRRYGKIHAYQARLEHLAGYVPNTVPDGPLTSPPHVVPLDCLKTSVIESYRECYRVHKSRFATWRAPAERPGWF